MLRLDAELLREVVEQAFNRARGVLAWETAIVKAAQQFGSNPYMHWDGGELLVLSESNELYRAGPTCQCTAYRWRKPCWHRAAARLLQRYEQARLNA